MRIVIKKAKPTKQDECSPISIQAFAELYGIALSVRERVGHYTACFSEVEIVNGGLLESAFGAGKTIDAAINDYVNTINKQKLNITGLPDFVSYVFKPYEASPSDTTVTVDV